MLMLQSPQGEKKQTSMLLPRVLVVFSCCPLSPLPPCPHDGIATLLSVFRGEPPFPYFGCDISLIFSHLIRSQSYTTVLPMSPLLPLPLPPAWIQPH